MAMVVMGGWWLAVEERVEDLRWKEREKSEKGRVKEWEKEDEKEREVWCVGERFGVVKREKKRSCVSEKKRKRMREKRSCF
jgi:hypothetical protein